MMELAQVIFGEVLGFAIPCHPYNRFIREVLNLPEAQ
jgi:hypothetical protein